MEKNNPEYQLAQLEQAREGLAKQIRSSQAALFKIDAKIAELKAEIRKASSSSLASGSCNTSNEPT